MGRSIPGCWRHLGSSGGTTITHIVVRYEPNVYGLGLALTPTIGSIPIVKQKACFVALF